MPDNIKNIENIIFDFDGTIADTLELGIKISNQLAKKYKYKEINSTEQLQLLRNQSTQDALKSIGVSLLKLPFVAASFRKRLTKDIHLLSPIVGIGEVIKELSNQYNLGIVTSNSKINTELFLKSNQLDSYISYYSTGIHLFRKNSIIDSMIKKYNLKRETVLLVGDETRDVEAANKCNLPIISVGWGFHTTSLLSSYNPNYIIDRPEELLKLLNKSPVK